MAAVEIEGLSKRFGKVDAVRDLSFSVEEGKVTGFLGPNGAGKTTTLRMLLGLARPTAGTATFGGRRYEQLDAPSQEVGAVLEDVSVHPSRSGRNHLRVLAAAGGHPESRVDELLDRVGLGAAADRRAKGYSMGMRQRLAIAAALLGDPRVLILDEPTNGLDPPGIRWMRDLVRAEAAAGKAVLISSHLLAEVAQSVDDVVIIANGRLRGHGPLDQVLGATGEARIRVRSPQLDRLAEVLTHFAIDFERSGTEALIVRGASGEQVGMTAFEAKIPLSELAPMTGSLEDAFLAITEQRGTGPSAPLPPTPERPV